MLYSTGIRLFGRLIKAQQKTAKWIVQNLRHRALDCASVKSLVCNGYFKLDLVDNFVYTALDIAITRKYYNGAGIPINAGALLPIPSAIASTPGLCINSLVLRMLSEGLCSKIRAP